MNDISKQSCGKKRCSTPKATKPGRWTLNEVASLIAAVCVWPSNMGAQCECSHIEQIYKCLMVCLCMRGSGEAFWHRQLGRSSTGSPFSWENKKSRGRKVAVRVVVLPGYNSYVGDACFYVSPLQLCIKAV